MDTFLLTKALNYHGQELLRAIEVEQGKEQLRCIDLRTLDYREYHKRAKEFGFKERQRRMKLFRFIGKKARQLYTPPDQNHVIPVTWDADNEDLCAVMPPFESFMSVPKIERRRHFMENLKKNDLLIGRVIERHEKGVAVHLVCLDRGKRREICDIRIKVGCNVLFGGNEDQAMSILDEYHLRDYVRAKVTEVVPKLETIKIWVLTEFKDIKMGVISEEEVPAHHKNYLKHVGKTYQQVLEQILGFANPATVSHMCKIVGLPPNNLMSLLTVLHSAKYPRDEYAVELREAQSAQWAYKSLRDGVSHFKAGNHAKAFQCLNKALQIHPENVEALVARGALYGNTSNLNRALEDFERALEIDPNHAKGKKYVSETLVALGRYYEDKGDTERAAKMYKRAIHRNSDNVDAKDALMAMEMREKQQRIMAAAKEQQLILAPPPLRTQERLVSHPYNMQQNPNTFLKEEKRAPDHARPPKRARTPPGEKAAVVHHMPSSDTRQEEVNIPQVYWSHQQPNWPNQQADNRVATAPQGYWPPQQDHTRVDVIAPQVYWPHQQPNMGTQGYWPYQQHNQNAVVPQGCWPPQEQNIEEKNGPQGSAIESQVDWSQPQDNNREENTEPGGWSHQQDDNSKELKQEPQGSCWSNVQDDKEKNSSDSSSSSDGSSSSSKRQLKPPPQQRPPSPKVLFMMRKEDDGPYSKDGTHSAFLEDDDNDDQPKSVQGSSSSRRSKGSNYMYKPTSSPDEEVASKRPRRRSPSYRSRHSSSEDEPRNRHRDHRSRDSHYPSHHPERPRKKPTDYRTRVINRATEPGCLKWLQEKKQYQMWSKKNEVALSPPPSSINVPNVPITPQFADSLSKARAIAFHITEGLRNDSGPPTKVVVPAQVKEPVSCQDKSIAAMEAYLQKLKAQKKL